MGRGRLSLHCRMEGWQAGGARLDYKRPEKILQGRREKGRL